VLSVAKDPQSQPVDFFSSILEKFKNNQKRNNSLSLKIRFPWLDIFVLSSVSLTSFECVFVCVFIWTWPINFFFSLFFDPLNQKDWKFVWTGVAAALLTDNKEAISCSNESLNCPTKSSAPLKIIKPEDLKISHRLWSCS
jgi:hypothetical protein